jgi:hypothetical protein
MAWKAPAPDSEFVPEQLPAEAEPHKPASFVTDEVGTCAVGGAIPVGDENEGGL